MGTVVLGKMPETVSSNVELSLPDGGTGTLPITFKMRSRKQMAAFEDDVSKIINTSFKARKGECTIHFKATNDSPCFIFKGDIQQGDFTKLYLGSFVTVKESGWKSLNGKTFSIEDGGEGFRLRDLDTTNTTEFPPESNWVILFAHDGEQDQRILSDVMDAHAEILMMVIAGWGLESKFEKDSVLQLLDEIPNSFSEILARYREVMRGERRKN